MKSIFAVVALALIIIGALYLPRLVTEPESSEFTSDPTNVRRWIDRYGNVTRDGRRWPDERIRDVYRDNPERAELLIRSPTPHYTDRELQTFIDEQLLPSARATRFRGAVTTPTLAR